MIKKTHYYQQVYDVVRQIPTGKVTTYGAIAEYLRLGSPRMVGWALHQGELNDSVPAHRVVNRKGELSGRNHFPTPDWMQSLLENEGITIKNATIQNFESVRWDPNTLEEAH